MCALHSGLMEMDGMEEIHNFQSALEHVHYPPVTSGDIKSFLLYISWWNCAHSISRISAFISSHFSLDFDLIKHNSRQTCCAKIRFNWDRQCVLCFFPFLAILLAEFKASSLALEPNLHWSCCLSGYSSFECVLTTVKLFFCKSS